MTLFLESKNYRILRIANCGMTMVIGSHFAMLDANTSYMDVIS